MILPKNGRRRRESAHCDATMVATLCQSGILGDARKARNRRRLVHFRILAAAAAALGVSKSYVNPLLTTPDGGRERGGRARPSGSHQDIYKNSGVFCRLAAGPLTADSTPAIRTP